MEKEVYPRHEFHVLTGVFAIILFVFMLFLALNNDTDVFTIALGLLPTIGYLIINYGLLYELPHKRFLVWVLPLVLVMVFYFFASMYGQKAFGGMELGIISFLNLFICYIFAGVILFYLFVQRNARREKQEIKELKRVVKERNIETVVEKHMPQPSIKMVIHSLEDKGKAINFVIGRVYSDKHGGSKDLRAKIRIEKEWYNTFSNLSQDFSEKDKELARVAVDLIYKRVLLLEKKEKEVFGDVKFVNIIRDPAGNETIKAVLIRNDKDPVESYVESAKEYCERILVALKTT